MMHGSATSHDVRIWSIAKYRGRTKTTYTVRWLVAGKKIQRTFATAKLADSFRTNLVVAARAGDGFDVQTGLPASATPVTKSRSWFEHALDYSSVKWPSASPRHRKGIAEALTAVTIALVRPAPGMPDETELRRALFREAFNLRDGRTDPSGGNAEAIAWVAKHSVPLSSLADSRMIRRALQALGTTLKGEVAAPATVARKRATLNNALEYAVELGYFDSNPLLRVRWSRGRHVEAVDKRVVVNPEQARRLLDAVWAGSPAVAGFLASMYYAALRPGEARSLRKADCNLPETGWGELILTGSHQTAGRAWTDSGESGDDRALKHRPKDHARTVPAHPELVAILRRHLATFAVGVDGRLFVARTGRAGVPLPPPFANPVSMNMVYRAWSAAREAALTPAQVATPLGRRPYDLRHACLSTWLNAGVPPAQVAEWAGHGVSVLLQVYAKCVDGEDELARRRIESAMAGSGVEASARIPRDQP
ncbi:MAG: phage integrase family protein [Marmoricola sp.]|nr:phage integrase family protein [Marmoricola sp.]